jgi:TonB-dependent starch-binding outer membrane protein SusC
MRNLLLILKLIERMKKIVSILFLLGMYLSVFAQNVQIEGTVTDGSTNEPLIGVNVVVKGNTSIGAVTDIDGNFKLKVPAKSTLVFTYVGYTTKEVAATKGGMKIQMFEDTKTLGEVVVIGYGVQKKSVVTASIAKVSSDELATTAPVRMDNALKGLASGVTVTASSGQPGAAAQVRIRGVGTINSSDPLYIVNGMPIEGGLDFLNPNDIQSIEVLKDAASAAVYGARGANGVVLVTTKAGKEGKAQINYDFSTGWQSAWKHRDVLNASEYAVMMNEGRVNSGQTPLYNDPYSYGEGTDWQKEVFNDNAPVTNHQVTISGASDKINYYLSLGYYSQSGIVGGNYGRSNYDRLTLGTKTKYNLLDATKERDFLNKLDLTVDINYARVHSTAISTNSQYGSPLGSALALSPILTPTLTGDAAKAQNDMYAGTADYVPMYDKAGNLYMLAGSSYNEMVNPLASLSLPGAKNWSHKVVANFAIDLNLWKGLKYRFTYGADQSFWGYDSHAIKYYLTANNKSTKTSATSDSERGTVWQIENTLVYDKTFGKHSFSVILGQSAFKNKGNYLGGTRYNLVDPTGDKASIAYATGLAENGDMSVWGGPTSTHTMASLFGRLSYNYDERYMLQATIRRDGSSRFGSNNKYATFPSFSLGWNVTNESFMEKRPDWFTNMKLRFSWGKNGNENIGDFGYVVLTSSGNNYILGNGENVITGVKASGLANPDLKWEESKQTDIGADFGFFNNALTFTVDWYKKTTNGMLMTMNIPSYVGETKPIGNVGKMQNTGLEFELSYKFKVSDANFRIAGNASYLKNKLLEYGNEQGWANLDAFQGAGTISRAQNGLPFPFFYGYKTNGIFQNQAEIDSYVNASGTKIQPEAKPGYVRFVDVDGDGKISASDRTKIGKGMPDWTFGLNFSAAWKGFDFNMMWQGVEGNDIFDATRRIDISATNLPSWMMARWTGEGTSNKYPAFILGDNANWQSSDLYVSNGSYLRLKNVQLGYTLPQRLTQKMFISKLRLFVSAENLLTFTKYAGFDPEISSGGTSLGIDYGVYPQARVWTVGFNIGF